MLLLKSSEFYSKNQKQLKFPSTIKYKIKFDIFYVMEEYTAIEN